MVSKDFIDSYKELFEIVLGFVVPAAKLYAIIIGAELLDDIRWIVHQIRKNAEGYNNNNKGAD